MSPFQPISSLPTPVGKQAEVLYLPDKGHVVVLGTAGSGKTTLAILRAAYLAFMSPTSRTLIVTFNKALVAFLKSALQGSKIQNLDVRNYHRFARGFLSSRGRMPSGSVISTQCKLEIAATVLSELGRSVPGSPVLRFSPEALAEEMRWIARMGIEDAPGYLDGRRRRAALPFQPEDYATLYAAFERYRELRKVAGYSCDWDDMAAMVCEELTADTSPRHYKHVVIDEGQDFSPTMLRSLVAAIPKDGSLTYFGDMAQQIYGSGHSWRDAGLTIQEPWKFEENYRNTREIAKLALAIAHGPFFRGIADLVEPHEPTSEGPPPTLVRCTDDTVVEAFTVAQAKRMGRTQTVAVLLRDRHRVSSYLKEIRAGGIPATDLCGTMPAWRPSPGVWVGTLHAAKGLEFDAVFLPHLDDSVIPSAENIGISGPTEACAEEARLLYMAVARAKTRLVMVYAGNVTRFLAAVNPSLLKFI